MKKTVKIYREEGWGGGRLLCNVSKPKCTRAFYVCIYSCSLSLFGYWCSNKGHLSADGLF